MCDNHRGISSLCIDGKISARLLLNRLICHLEKGLLPESQSGFCKNRGTLYSMIFAARQLQENCQKHNVELYCTFVDLTKAFDTVSREASLGNHFIDMRRSDQGGFFNIRCLKSKRQSAITRVCEFLFADDCALNAKSAENMQLSMDLFAQAFGLTINTQKTEVLHQPGLGKDPVDPGIPVNGEKLKWPMGSTLLR
ncbi:uncharacterized protein LOC125026901 [Penaeus chinensis]|uniref:uncharacterized protein LOC125026901 n=1 Tax=Penaeus chinensis TaxID=139456 RepID=UPI001FB5BE99|nr:uncharacterized protein LOC125026901 [Penaeus chinensis]